MMAHPVKGARVLVSWGPNVGRTGTLERPLVPSAPDREWILTIDPPGPAPGTALVTSTHQVTDRIICAPAYFDPVDAS